MRGASIGSGAQVQVLGVGLSAVRHLEPIATSPKIGIRGWSGQSGGCVEWGPLAPNVTVIKDGKPATLSDLGPGEAVTVTRNAQGLVTQIQIGSK